jgi:prevent-host-death family protein
MKSIGAAKFKEQCLSLLDHLSPDGLVVTKHGKPVAVVLPIPSDPDSLIGSMKNKIKVNGDLLSTGLNWDAND